MIDLQVIGKLAKDGRMIVKNKSGLVKEKLIEIDLSS